MSGMKKLLANEVFDDFGIFPLTSTLEDGMRCQIVII